MNLDFSQEQKLLADQARRYLDDKGGVQRARRVLEDSDQSCDSELWQDMAKMGWLGTAIPEQYGGVGMGYLELCVLAEQLGRVLAPVPFASTLYLFAEALLQFGSEEQKSAYLPRIAAGELTGTVALAEQTSAPTEADLQCRFENGALTGDKIAVADGDIARMAAVLARDGGELGMYLVDLEADGVERSKKASLDDSKSYANIRFSGASAELIGRSGAGWQQWQALSDRAAVLFAFEQLGGADSALEMARSYALERYAFGRPIGSYQAVKHRLADMYIGSQLARSNCYYAAWALSTDAAELPVAAAAARVSASQAADFNSQENIQLHGGMGFTWEFDCHLFYRRSKVLALAIGSPAEWKDRLIGALERSNLPR